jgi:hypothetical protein
MLDNRLFLFLPSGDVKKWRLPFHEVKAHKNEKIRGTQRMLWVHRESQPTDQPTNQSRPAHHSSRGGEVFQSLGGEAAGFLGTIHENWCGGGVGTYHTTSCPGDNAFASNPNPNPTARERRVRVLKAFVCQVVMRLEGMGSFAQPKQVQRIPWRWRCAGLSHCG